MTKTRFVALAALTATLLAPTGSAQGDVWYSVGLAGQDVRAILSDDTSAVVAGTDEGLFVLFNKQWSEVSFGAGGALPVEGLARLSTGDIVVVAGTNPGGLYLGRNIINGPPFYSLSRIDTITSPQSMTVRGTRNDTVYVGAGNRVLRSIQTTPGTFGRLTPLRLMSFAFGVEMPVCPALHVCTSDNKLYAGGYDRSPMGGSGRLVSGASDTLAPVRTMSVTAITQGVFFEVGPVELVVGTADSGIYTATPSGTMTWTRYDSPNRQSVNHMIALPGLMWSDILYIAVAGGVYSGTRGNWTEVGNIPVVPNVLGTAWYDVPYAGTVDGVYRYGQPPSAVRAQETHHSAGASATAVSAYNAQGRRLRADATAVRARQAPVLIHK